VSQVIVFLALAFAILIAIFAAQNSTTQDVRFLGLTATGVPISVLVLVSAMLGAGVILLLGLAREVSHRWRQRSLSNQLKTANARIATLEAAQAASAPPVPVEAPALGAGEATQPIPVDASPPAP
jgi:uncharacterized integral membrane protein